MIRDVARKHLIGMNKEFRYRGEETTRIETLSDAGFALAIGLLLISTSPPTNFEQLKAFTRDLLPFAVCITLIMLVWFEHFIFFLRYGFRNARVVLLNTLLLFLILFYVYPLKFLARLLIDIYGVLLGRLIGIEGSMKDVFSEVIKPQEVPQLMVIYGLGAATIFLTLMLMFRYALRHAAELELNELEIFDTKTSMLTNLLMASVPLTSVLFALLIKNSAISGTVSGFIYFLYVPVMTIFGMQSNKRRKKFLAKQASPSS